MNYHFNTAGPVRQCYRSLIFNSSYGVKDYFEGGLLLEKGLRQSLTNWFVPESRTITHPEVFVPAPGICFLGYDVRSVGFDKIVLYNSRFRKNIHFTFYWRADARSFSSLRFLVKLKGVERPCLYNPFYGIFPTDAWPAGAVIKDDCVLSAELPDTAIGSPDLIEWIKVKEESGPASRPPSAG